MAIVEFKYSKILLFTYEILLYNEYDSRINRYVQPNLQANRVDTVTGNVKIHFKLELCRKNIQII